jgi:hypothetical protein
VINGAHAAQISRLLGQQFVNDIGSVTDAVVGVNVQFVIPLSNQLYAHQS